MPKRGAVTEEAELPAEKLVKEPKEGAKNPETKESLREKAALAAAVNSSTISAGSDILFRSGKTSRICRSKNLGRPWQT
jgi:hypothetical protein